MIKGGQTSAAADCGSMAVEGAIFGPLLITFALVALALGRVTIAHGSVEAAARDAARQASISRDPGTARRRALTSANAALNREGLKCPARVSVDVSGLNRPAGQNATITATVTCTVDLADLAVPGLPGSRTLSATFTSPIDPYRGR